MSRFRKWNAAKNWDHPRGPGGKFRSKAGGLKKKYKANKKKRLPESSGPQKIRLRTEGQRYGKMDYTTFNRLPTGRERRQATALAGVLTGAVGLAVGGPAGAFVAGGTAAAVTNRNYRTIARNTATHTKMKAAAKAKTAGGKVKR